MKKSKIVVLIKILAIVILCLIAFGGMYFQELNSMKNIVKDYKVSEDLKGYREVVYEVKAEENVEENAEENEENKTEETTNEDNKEETKKEESKEDKVKLYEKSKSIIEDRLKDLKVENYNIGLDKKTGEIYLKLAENSETDNIVSNLKESGKFEIKDSEDGTILLDNSKIVGASVKYNTTESGTIVYLEVEFNKEGKDILTDITTNKYAKPKEEENKTEESNEEEKTEEDKTTEETESAEENKEEKKENKITLTLSGTDITTTNFETPITGGVMQLSLNQATKDPEEIESSLNSASKLATNINKGPLEVEYTIIRNRYVETEISRESLNYVILSAIIIMAALLVFMAVKYKVRGILAAIAYIGFLALYSLLLRYTNVVISLESIISIIMIGAINYWISMRLLKIDKEDKTKYNKEYMNIVFKVLPIFLISIVFTFAKWTPVNTVGMAFLWGIALILLYNRFIAKNIVD